MSLPSMQSIQKRFKPFFTCFLLAMNDTNEKEQLKQFKQAQEQLGITQVNFESKFVFSQSQITEGYLLSRYKPTPSQIHGFSNQDIQIVSAHASQLIHQAGILLKIPVSTTVLAQCILHYFYARKSFLDYDYRDIAMGATFLACKSEQTLRKSYQVSSVFDQLFKIQQGQKRPVKVLDPNSAEYSYIKKTVIKAQNDILFQLGFQVYKLFDIPHRYISGFLNLFDKHPQISKIASKSWAYLNDIYQTRMCLFYTGQVIAATAIYLSLRTQKINFPKIPWWCLMQSSLTAIEDIACEVLSLSQKSDKINIDNVSAIIKQLSEKKHGVSNVFPVPYYRKIMLDNRNKLRVKKDDQDQQTNIQKKDQKRKQKPEQTNRSEQKNNRRQQRDQPKYTKRSPSQDSYKRRKRQKKQRKKKQKQRRRQRQRSNSSQSRRQNYKKRNKKVIQHASQQQQHIKQSEKLSTPNQISRETPQSNKSAENKNRQQNVSFQSSKIDISANKQKATGLNLDKVSFKISLNSLMMKHQQKMINIERDNNKNFQDKQQKQADKKYQGEKSQSEQDQDLKILAQLKARMQQNKNK